MDDREARIANDPAAGGRWLSRRIRVAVPFLISVAILFDGPSALWAQPGSDSASRVVSTAPSGRPDAAIAGSAQKGLPARVFLPYVHRQGWLLRTTVGGGSFALASLGPDTVLVGVGRRVMSLDVSDPLAIRELDRSPMLPGLAWRMVVDGGAAFVAHGKEGFSALDVRDPGDLRMLASFPVVSAHTSDVEANGSVVYGAGESLTTYVRSGDSWRVAARLGLPQPANAMVEVDGFVFATQSRAGLAIIDARDPEHPMLVGIAEAACEDCSASSGDVAVVGDFALIPDGYRTRILDVGDKARPRHVATIEGQSEPRRIAVDGHRAYVFGQSGGTQVLDIADPSRPSELRSLRGHVHDGVVADGRLFTVGLDATLRIHDLTAADEAPPLGEHRTLMSADLTAGGDGVSFVADGARIWTVGADAEGALHEIGSVSIGVRPQSMTAVGRLAFAATAIQVGSDHHDNLHIIRAKADGLPEIVATVPVPGIQRLAAAGNFVYAVGIDGVTVLDVADPTRPMIMAVLPSSALPALDHVASVAVEQDLLAVAGTTYGANGSSSEVARFWLYTLDVTDPSQPRVGSSLQLPAQPVDLAMVERVVYVAEWEFGLRIVDASDPLRPRLFGSVPTRSQPRGLAVGAGRLYVSETFFLSESEHALLGSPGIRMFDVAQALNPVPMMTLDEDAGGLHMDVGGGGELLLDGGFDGLVVIDAG